MECGRYITGPYGILVTRSIHKKEIYRNYIGVDACMADLMRPGMYGSYHHISVVGKSDAPCAGHFDVVGSLCENNDKFAIQRELPSIEEGDLLIIHDTGAHGHSMGFNYNGKVRAAELLLREDGSVIEIRRRETLQDIFATLPIDKLEGFI
jgi:diaminopimelate decarboxylase